jgi:hypothetical protein
MENLERYYEILGVKRGASLKDIREAYKCLQEEYSLEYYSKSSQNACEALREVYSAYKKLKVFHKEHPEEFASDEQDGLPVNAASATGESAIYQAGSIRDDARQAGDESAPVEFPALSIARQVVAGYNKSDAVRILNEKLAALKAEIDRLTPDKAAAAKAVEDAEKSAARKDLHEQLVNAETDSGTLSARMAPPAMGAAENDGPDEIGAGTVVSPNPAPVRFHRLLAYGTILGAVCVLAYTMVTPRRAVDVPSLMRPSQETLTTRKAAPPEAETKRIISPVQVVKKQALATSSVVKPSTTVSTLIKEHLTAHSAKWKRTAAASGKKPARTTGRSQIAGIKTSYKPPETMDGNNPEHAVMSAEIKEPKYQADINVAAVTRPAETAATPPPPAMGFHAAVGTPYAPVHAAKRYYLFSGNIWYAVSFNHGPWVRVSYRTLPWRPRIYPVAGIRYVRNERDYKYRHFRPRYRPYKHWEDGDGD